MLAFVMCAALGQDAAARLLDAIRETRIEEVQAALKVAAAETPRAIGFLKHPSWQVRLAAVRAARSAPEAAGPLVELLPGADARLRADWQAGRFKPEAPKERPAPGRTTFYEIPVVSTRLCFVIDRSR